jgi:hypothetical protein
MTRKDVMKEIIGLLCGFCFAVIAIYLNVSGTIGKTALLIILAFSIAGGLAIANYDRIHFKGGGFDVKTMRKEINLAKDSAIDEIRKEVSEQKESIALLINEQDEKLRKTIEMAAPPTLSLLDKNIEKTDSGYKAILRFKPSKNQLLGQIALMSKITDETNAKITKFWPKLGPAFITGPDSEKISNDGKEAILTYGLMAVGYPEVELHLSDSAKVEVSGNLLTEQVVFEIK